MMLPFSGIILALLFAGLRYGLPWNINVSLLSHWVVNFLF